MRHSKNQITACYRPPEILFGAAHYGPSADVWSAGCILAELIMKNPLFPGANPLDLLQRIYALRGTPDEKDWPKIDALENFKLFTKTSPQPWTECLPLEKGYEGFHDLLDRMLQLNPNKRISAGEALCHPYFTQQPPPCENHELPMI